MIEDTSELISKGECPDCGSSDACARYSDGHSFCYSCNAFTPGAGGDHAGRSDKREAHADLIQGTVTRLTARHLSAETCAKWGYTTATYNGKPVQVATYCDEDGTPVAQKLRFADKSSMPWLGNKKQAAPLYGMWLWKPGGRQIVVTEGELDALSVSQAFGNKWAAVSVAGGAAGAYRDVEKAIAYLSSFERVVFMLDNDEPGKEAALRCAALLQPGKAFIATLPLKDASDMLVAGKVKELSDAAWQAKPFRPDGIVTVADVREAALTPRTIGARWFVPGMSEDTFGTQPGQLIAIGAGTGVGKTDFLTQQIAYQVTELGESVGAIFLETPAGELLQRIAGKATGHAFHAPDGTWTQTQLREAIAKVEAGAPLHFYDSVGAIDWATVRGVILHMAVGLRCKHIYLDHLTALAAMEEDEKKAIEQIMAELAGIAQQNMVRIYLVSHLATPDGKPHEEGGRVAIRHFKGSRAIGYWSHFMLGLERDQQCDDAFEQTVTTVRVLKDRYSGRSTGNTYRMAYDRATGLLHSAPPKEVTAKSLGFKTIEPTSHEDF